MQDPKMRKYFSKEMSIPFTETQVRQAKNNKKPIKDDTELRLEIQLFIRKSIGQGDSKEDIISNLKGEERFSKYSEFFDTWIQHAIKQASSKEIRRLENTFSTNKNITSTIKKNNRELDRDR